MSHACLPPSHLRRRIKDWDWEIQFISQVKSNLAICTNFFQRGIMIGIRRFSSGIFRLVFILAFLGLISEVGVCEQTELRLAAWNIRIMSNKSRTDAELMQIARTLGGIMTSLRLWSCAMKPF